MICCHTPVTVQSYFRTFNHKLKYEINKKRNQLLGSHSIVCFQVNVVNWLRIKNDQSDSCIQ